jgi:hypothetical protein
MLLVHVELELGDEIDDFDRATPPAASVTA